PAFNPPNPRNIRKLQAEAGPYLEALEAVCRADGGHRREPGWEKFFEPQPTPIEPILKGRHLIERGHAPGPAFREMLARAYEHQLETGESNLEALYQVAVAGRGPSREELSR
ncbi:MAG: CCA tRNA nucleotidyltransferase, partial [Thermus sp.]|nr:CCA tRNA nucleotidyltransferase [Thermus sp.]